MFFRYANEQREKYWFCKPCRPYHDLVYAKQKGFPYWPAKVVGRRKKGDTLDVRFFGGYHQKATVEKSHAKPITVNVHTLQVKRTSLWNKACEELRKHQELLAKYKNDESFHSEPYGNHFVTAPAGGDVRSQWAMNFGNSGHDSSQESDDDDENAENNSDSPEKAQAKPEGKKGKAQKQEAPTPSKLEESPVKKKKGKGKKMKKVRINLALILFP